MRDRLNRRRSRPRARVINYRYMRKAVREEVARATVAGDLVLTAEEEAERPRTRGDCRGHVGPCPWVSCKFHLYLDVNPETGSIKINFPDLDPLDLAETCALDVAERGAHTLEEMGLIMNLTRERMRQLEVRGLLKLRIPLTLAVGDD